MKEIRIKDLSGLSDAAREFVTIAEPGRVYAFYGPMGAGKTTFIAELCRLLGSDDEANSPTFSIVNEYDTRAWGCIYHLDCYRLESEEEGYDIGVEDYFSSGNTCFVEWPERIAGLLPEDAVEVTITVSPADERTLTVGNFKKKL